MIIIINVGTIVYIYRYNFYTLNIVITDVNFITLKGHGGIRSNCPFEDGHYVQTKKTWYEAREDCVRRGTDLYVNEDMDFSVCDLTKTTYKTTWIGIRNVRWIEPDKHKKGYTYF